MGDLWPAHKIFIERPEHLKLYCFILSKMMLIDKQKEQELQSNFCNTDDLFCFFFSCFNLRYPDLAIALFPAISEFTS